MKKEGPNKGRKFLKCPKPKGSQCGFFKWADDISTSDLTTRGGQSESNPMSQVSGQDEGSIPTQSYDTSQQPDISNQSHYIQPHSTPLSGMYVGVFNGGRKIKGRKVFDNEDVSIEGKLLSSDACIMQCEFVACIVRQLVFRIP